MKCLFCDVLISGLKKGWLVNQILDCWRFSLDCYDVSYFTILGRICWWLTFKHHFHCWERIYKFQDDKNERYNKTSTGKGILPNPPTKRLHSVYRPWAIVLFLGQTNVHWTQSLIVNWLPPKLWCICVIVIQSSPRAWSNIASTWSTSQHLDLQWKHRNCLTY